jgi:nitroreductase
LQQEVERGLPTGFANDYKNGLMARFNSQSKDQHFEHAARQAYIGFGLAIGAAAELRVDATPMEGFDNAAIDQFLGLNELGLRSVTILALGHRDIDNDWLVKLKKVRIAKEDFVISKN